MSFDPAYRSSSLADHTGLTDLNDEELEAAYSRAKDFLMDKKRELMNVHGWSVQSEDDKVHNDLSECCGLSCSGGTDFIRPYWTIWTTKRPLALTSFIIRFIFR